MSDTTQTPETLSKTVSRRAERRRFLRNAGVAGLGALAANHLSASSVFAQAPTDTDIFNFALNLEYLEAEFYVRAIGRSGLADADTTGTGTRGNVVGGRAVPFVAGGPVQQYAIELANDEEAHVRFLRTALGSAAVARPAINFPDAFNAAAAAAGLPTPFDAFANETNFLLASFIFEDVGVTAYKGASPLITDATNLENAAGILAVEAYHAGTIRNVLFARGFGAQANAISDARDRLDGATDLDQGILDRSRVPNAVVNNLPNIEANIVPSDPFGVAFSRTAGQVLNVVYLTAQATTQGGFFPQGVNGTIRTSAASS